jgi:hypothetical protein
MAGRDTMIAVETSVVTFCFILNHNLARGLFGQ